MSENQRAVVFVNGVVENYGWIEPFLKPNDILIAVDGGYRHMKALNLIPHLLIGDLDSVDEQDVKRLSALGVEIHKYPQEKDETDLEIVFLTARERGYSTLRVIGAFGGRMDHWLANLFALTHPAYAQMDICYEDDQETAFIIRSEGVVNGNPGDLLSLIPMGGAVTGVRTEGLKYPLRDETLYAHLSRGVSNEFLGGQARVTIEEGLLLCIHLRTNSPA